ncbi:UPF0481 protein At3g47200-like [Rhodamnia argentea]|uniref:UPF0481 protein At3g47200-like n=1 Tax=Rhodamnia argentea TaxID=178133 RepID=A0ABM3GYQ1_9MYRT|nr:UPF0481 protein At3g47200-like [Rhodamnia argentea]
MLRADNSGPQSLGLVIDIENRLCSRGAVNAESRWTIDRVPDNLRKVHSSAFDPEMIGIGPFHGESRLQVMQGHKLRFLNRLLEGNLARRGSGGDVSRTTEGERASDDRECKEDNDGDRIAKAELLDDIMEAMRILKDKTRACYQVTPEIDEDYLRSDYFVEKTVVDGCFVVELLRLYHDRFCLQPDAVAIQDDPIFTNPRILTTLRRDLLLLENQLPFFVLDKLYELINKSNNIDHQQAVRLEVLAVTFFNPLLLGHDAASKLDNEKPKPHHLLQVFRSTFLKSESEKAHKKGSNWVKSRSNPKGSIMGIDLHFASELEEAGVRFEKRRGHGLLDIQFRHHTLRVPPLPINEHAISLLLNCVAYELNVDQPEPIFANYLMFWNSLVNSPGDVQILHNHGIINNTLGSNVDVANLLVRCREVIYDRDLGYLHDEIKNVNDYCERYYESKCRVWWRSLIRERFSSPWTCLSLFAAIILLLLTFLQTIYTVYPYYRPN